MPRLSNITVPSIQKNLLSELELIGETKEFKSLMRPKIVINNRSGENSVVDESAYEYFNKIDGPIIHQREELIKDKIFFLQKNSCDTYKDNYSSIKNLLYQLYSLKTAFQESEKNFIADIYAIIRPDLLYHDKIPSNLIKKISGTTVPIAILPEWQWCCGVNDRFMFCNRSAVSSIATRFDDIEGYIPHSRFGLHAERYLHYILRKNSIKILTTTMKASRTRTTGQIKNEIFSPMHSAGGPSSKLRVLIASARTLHFNC